MQNPQSQNRSSMQASKPSTSFDQNSWLMEKIALASILKPGVPVLNPNALVTLVESYSKLVDEIGVNNFETAYTHVWETSKFRPDIAEIRAAAGAIPASPAELSPDSAANVLASILAAMREQGWRLQGILGPVLNDGRDENGQILAKPKRAPCTPPATFSPQTERAILLLGFGDRKSGLGMLACHPTITGFTEEERSFQLRDARDIEQRWAEVYLRAKSEARDDQ